MAAVEDVVRRAADFITPFLNDGGDLKQKQDQIQAILFESSPADDRETGRQQLVRKALSLLHEIHDADRATPQDAPYDGTLVAMVYGLIDAVVLQGIRPSVFDVIGPRPQIVLVSGASGRTPKDIPLLAEVIVTLCSILKEKESGIAPLLTERALIDIVVGAAELAFSPDISDDMHIQSVPQFRELMRNTPVRSLVPVISLFRNGGAPQWLKSSLTTSLQTIPLRPHGVRQLIELISLGHGGLSNQENITQATRLLALPPSAVTLDSWYKYLGPQLCDLLDGKAGAEMSSAAGQIIATILMHKSLGAPGEIAWQTFVQPLLLQLNPPFEGAKVISERLANTNKTLEEVLVPEVILLQSLSRLLVLANSHPHPGLAKRLIRPVLLPLWGSLSYTQKVRVAPIWSETLRSILLRYFEVAEAPQYLDMIACNLFWDGEPTWTYGPGEEGGIEIRRRPAGNSDLGNLDNIITRLESLDQRISTFINLLIHGKVDDAMVITIFLSVTKRWLSSARGTKSANSSLINSLEEDPLETLTHAKLSEAMGREIKNKIAAHPKLVVEFVKTLLEEFVEEQNSKQARERELKGSRYASLGNIVQNKATEDAPSPTADQDSNPEEDLVAFALSFLQTIINDPNFQKSAQIDTLLSSITPIIGSISSEASIRVTTSTRNAATNLLSLISSARISDSSPISTDLFAESRSALSIALSELQSPEPPLRAHGLSDIRKLAESDEKSHLIDIPSTTHAILSLSLYDPDSFVHTAAISTLVSLTSLAPALVTGILTNAFVDEDETSLKSASQTSGEETSNTTSSLDFRLRVGQTLYDILSSHLIWDSGHAPLLQAKRALHAIISTALLLSSRRGPHRSATLAARESAAASQLRLRKEGEEAWGGEMPSLTSEEPESPTQALERETLERIMHGWEDTGLEEDIRIRQSALSISGKALEVRLESVRQEDLDRAVEIVLGVLVLEGGVERAIVRRAGVLVVMGLLKGLDGRFESGNERGGSGVEGIGLKVEKWNEVERVLKWVRDQDADEVVRGHATDVLEALETWREKVWFGLRANEVEGERMRLSTGLEGPLRGLAVDPDAGKRGEGKMMIEEIE